MDKATKRHLERRGVFDTAVREWERPFSERNRDFFAWFEETVMGFDSDEYRSRFWREARRSGHTIGPKPYGMREHTSGRGSIALYFALMGASFFFWIARREIDRHLHRLRRPTYYEAERARRLALAEERRRLRRRRTLNERPCMDAIRDALARAHESVEDMVRLGSLMEDLECHVDNSPYFREDGSFAGRRGGIRRLLQEEAPDLYARYKTLMKYKALSKRFRQAVGVGDPIPASSVLPSAEATVEAMAAGSGGAGSEAMGAKCGGTAEGNARAAETSARNAAIGGDVAVTGAEAGLAAALREAKEVFRRSRELISDCECSVASLAAQLARRVDPDYAPRVAPEITTAIASSGGAGGGARGAPAETPRRKRPA
jgi:hypothetical protein